MMHAEMLQRHCRRGARILDAGCGPGRFTIVAAKMGARVTALDLSPGQLELAKQHVREAGVEAQVEDYLQGDVVDLSRFPANTFDVVVCFGGPLSYARDLRRQAAAELVRVTKPGGAVVVSVMSRFGATLSGFHRSRWPDDFTAERVRNVLADGDLSGVPSSRLPTHHPPMHLYTSKELAELLPSCEVLEIAGSNVCAKEGQALEEPSKDPVRWEMVIDAERRLSKAPGLLDSGTHIMMAARKLR